jgi:pimeloyl-ACP methyl ester carboxylesterase
LAARGVTVLRFDKAFSGQNPGLPIADLTLDTYRDEASAALDFLHARAEVDPTRVFVAGHSEGGIHATRLAESRGDRIRGVILISAPGRSLREVLEVQLERNVLSATAMTPEQIEAEMAPVRTALRSFVAGQDVDPKSASSHPQIVAVLSALMAPRSPGSAARWRRSSPPRRWRESARQCWYCREGRTSRSTPWRIRSGWPQRVDPRAKPSTTI